MLPYDANTSGYMNHLHTQWTTGLLSSLLPELYLSYRRCHPSISKLKVCRRSAHEGHLYCKQAREKERDAT